MLSPDPNADLFRENQRLRGRVRGLGDEVAGLKAQLAYALREVEHLRAQINKPMQQAAEPVDPMYRTLVPVTPGELDAVLVRLREHELGEADLDHDARGSGEY